MGKSAINPAVVGKHSTDIAALKNDLGIVEDGDTATHTIAQGQYVIWQGALYTADAAIASGTTLAASGGNKNLTAVENGGLNALNSNITTLNDRNLPELQVNETVSIGNQCMSICAYGWSGLRAIGQFVAGCGRYLPPTGTYTVSIRSNQCSGKKTSDTSMTNLVSKISSIVYNATNYKVVFNFSSAPFGTSDDVIIISFDGSITRTS